MAAAAGARNAFRAMARKTQVIFNLRPAVPIENNGDSTPRRRQIVESDQVDFLASTVLGYFEKVQNAQKNRLARQRRSNIREAYRLNRVHLDLAFIDAVPAAHLHVGAHPDAHAARDLPTAAPLAKPFGKHHAESLSRRERNEARRSTYPARLVWAMI